MGKEFDISDRASVIDICSYESSAGPCEGFFYILELDNKRVKIGSSARPSKRMYSLLHLFRDYSELKCRRVYISEPHVNYKDSETRLLNFFKDKRKPSTEICRVKYNQALLAIGNCVNIQRVTQSYLEQRDASIENARSTLMKALGYDKMFMLREFYCNEAYASMFSFILSEAECDEALYFVEVIVKDKEHWFKIFANSFQTRNLMDSLMRWGVISKGSELMDYYNKEYSDRIIKMLLCGDKNN